MVKDSDRGAAMSDEGRAAVTAIVEQLEAVGLEEPLKSPLVFGAWEVAYTSRPTAAGGYYRSMLGRTLLRSKDLVQTIYPPNGVDNLVEFDALSLIPGSISLKGTFEPLDNKWVRAVFEAPNLALGALKFSYGGQSSVRLSVSYLDERVRIGRGSQGSIFVFARRTAGVAVFDLDYDAILAAMYALSTSDEGDCYLCVPPDPGIEAAALGAGETAALGASAFAAPGAGESAPSGTASAQVFHTFTLDSGASRSFFRDRTTLTPLSRPVAVSLADPSGGPVLASFSTVLPCPAAPSGSLSGLYLPSFSTNLVSGADLQDQGVDQFTPANQLNLQPRVSLPETSPTLLWTGKFGDASAFRVWGSQAFVRDLSADKLSPRAVPCVFLGFPPDAPGRQFYHPTLRRVLSSQDVTFDESVPYYRLFPYRTASLPPPPLFLAPDAVEPVEVAVDSGAATGAEPAGAGSGGAGSGGADTEGAEPGGAETWGAEPWGAETGGAEPGGTEPGGAEPGVTAPGGAEPGGAGSARVASRGASSRREVLSPQELSEWFARRWGRAARAGGPTATTCPGSAGAAGPGGPAEAAGVGPTGVSTGASGGTGATGSAGPGAAGATGAGAAGGVGAGGSADASTSEGAGAGAAGAGGATGTGAPAGSPGAVPARSGGAPRPRPYFVPLLEQVLGLLPSPGPAPSFECPQPVQSQSLLQPVSPLPAPSPYTGPTGGLAERRAPASRPASPARPACTSRRTSRPRPPAVPGTYQMALRPSTAPLRVPLPSPPASSLPAFPDPESDSLRAASPTVARFLATVVTDPSLASTAASALVAELVDFAACCRLDYAASLVAESASVCPPSVGGECALSTDVLEDRQEEFQCFAAALPHLVSTLLAPEGDPDAPESFVVSAVRVVDPVCVVTCGLFPVTVVIGLSRAVILTVVLPSATQRSSQGYTFSLGSGSVSWRSTRSSSVLSSSCEAEIYAGAMAAQELRWLTYLLTDLGEQPRSPPVLYVDNKAMLALCREHRLEHRTKHIALRYFLARELQQRGQLCLAYVASEANTADIFTKALAPGDHQRFCTLLGLLALLCLTGLVTSCSPPFCLWGFSYLYPTHFASSLIPCYFHSAG
ncbi:unnamed protein product [Closterium sp. NIES-53]